MMRDAVDRIQTAIDHNSDKRSVTIRREDARDLLDEYQDEHRRAVHWRGVATMPRPVPATPAPKPVMPLWAFPIALGCAALSAAGGYLVHG